MSWIEASLRFLEQLEKKDYAHHFGISPASVSRDMHEFVAMMNGRGGDLKVVAGKIEGRLPEAPSPGLPCMREILAASSSVRLLMVSEEMRTDPAPYIVRDLFTAIKRRRVVGMEYTSMRGGAAIRRISPWRFVDVSGRLHVQAYDHGVNALRDFVLTRILGGITQIPQATWVKPPEDRYEAVVIQENQSLEPAQRAAVRADFGLDAEGRRTFRVRKSLSFYLRAEFGERSEDYVAPVQLQ
ncbi:WYL domain-containing protein [Paracoccus liaowanqingii]|nr:WYL domain-containing protein [Paracoccus liaowanqingii]